MTYGFDFRSTNDNSRMIEAGVSVEFDGVLYIAKGFKTIPDHFSSVMVRLECQKLIARITVTVNTYGYEFFFGPLSMTEESYFTLERV